MGSGGQSGGGRRFRLGLAGQITQPPARARIADFPHKLAKRADHVAQPKRATYKRMLPWWLRLGWAVRAVVAGWPPGVSHVMCGVRSSGAQGFRSNQQGSGVRGEE